MCNHHVLSCKQNAFFPLTAVALRFSVPPFLHSRSPLVLPSLPPSNNAPFVKIVPRRPRVPDQPRTAHQHVRVQPAARQSEAHRPVLGLHHREHRVVRRAGRKRRTGLRGLCPTHPVAGLDFVLVWHDRPSRQHGKFFHLLRIFFIFLLVL